MSYATLERLLSEDGDCTAPQPLKAPAPTPQPSPTPPGPSPIPVPPPPAPDHQHLLQELARLIRNGEARLVDFLDRHNL